MTNIEKELMHESLHNIYDDDQFEDFGRLEIKSCDFSEAMSVKLILEFNLENGENAKKYEVNLDDIPQYLIRHSTNPYIEILSKDMRLLLHNSIYESLYFRKPAVSSSTLIKDVCEILDKKYEMKISLIDLFSSYDRFIYRSEMDYGLFVSSATEIINDLIPVLEKQGMEPQKYPVANSNTSNYKIIYIGRSWFVFKNMSMKSL